VMGGQKSPGLAERTGFSFLNGADTIASASRPSSPRLSAGFYGP